MLNALAAWARKYGFELIHALQERNATPYKGSEIQGGGSVQAERFPKNYCISAIHPV